MIKLPSSVAGVFFAALFIILAPAALAEDLPGGLVGYWTFDDGEGGLAADALDANPGTLNGPAWADGIVGGALEFDGDDDRVDFGTSSDFELYPPLTLEAWVFPQHWGGGEPQFGDPTVIAKGDTTFRYYILQVTHEGFRFRTESGFGNVFSGPLEAGRWYHVVGVHDGSAATLYVNGWPRQSLPAPVNNPGFSSQPLTAGNEPNYFGDPDRWFDGLIDEMAIYNRALTREEIEVHYYNGLAGRGLTESGMDYFWVPNTVTFGYTEVGDEVLPDELLPARVELNASLSNWSQWQDPTLPAPGLTLTTPHPVEWIENDEYLVPGSTYHWQFPDLGANGGLNVRVGLGPGVEPTTFAPGFRVTRTVTEPEIAAPGGQQTVSVTLVQEETELDGVALSGVNLQVWGGWDYPYFDAFPSAFVADPNFDCNLSGNYVSCYDPNPSAPRTYQVQVTFDVGVYQWPHIDQPWDRIAYTPTVNVAADFNCCDEVLVATSITEPTAWGSWTWETSENRLWHSQYGLRKWVELEQVVNVLNHAPVAICQDVEVVAGTDCNADVSIDAGSYDLDNNLFSTEQNPPPPYIPYSTGVTLTVTDELGASDTCYAEVVVVAPDADGDFWAPCGGDCDDSDPSVFPGAEELCDGKDNDCNGIVDDGAPDSDGDTVADCRDNCPTAYNPGQEDWNLDAIGDACQDSDGDGLLDETEIGTADPEGCPDPGNPDSDFDTLLDGAEIDAGTDPCSEDTDGDGVPDAEDPLPTDPGVTSSYLEEELRETAVAVAEMDLALFNGNHDNANKGRRNSLANRARGAANAVSEGDFQEAIEKLESLLAKIDGNSPPPDWLHPSEAQAALAELIVLHIQLLELM